MRVTTEEVNQPINAERASEGLYLYKNSKNLWGLHPQTPHWGGGRGTIHRPTKSLAMRVFMPFNKKVRPGISATKRCVMFSLAKSC